MMNDQALDRLAKVVYGDDESLLTAEQIFRIRDAYGKGTGDERAREALYLANDLYATSPETPPVWYVSVRNYNRILWWNHCARAYSFPRRKLRKCAMRRVVRRRQRERRRYL